MYIEGKPPKIGRVLETPSTIYSQYQPNAQAVKKKSSCSCSGVWLYLHLK